MDSSDAESAASPAGRGSRARGEPAESTQVLPELASVSWRRRASAVSVRRDGRLWTATALAHSVPLVLAAVGLAVLAPVTVPVSLVLLAHAWAIPELYAARGAGVVRRAGPGCAADGPERLALGLLGDLVGHEARQLYARTGLMLERAGLGVWLLGPAGALLVTPGGRRVHCYCVRATDPGLPAGDRVAHLLLALRTDECGFATVANRAFAGAPWRLRRRLAIPAREALAIAVGCARTAAGPHRAAEVCTWGQCPV